MARPVSNSTGATPPVAKLDRLSRNAAVAMTFRQSGARLVVAELPDANDFTAGIMAPVAEREREAISRRTKEALAALSARGAKLGNLERRRGAEAGWSGRPNADRHAEDLGAVVEDIRSGGQAICTQLPRRRKPEAS